MKCLRRTIREKRRRSSHGRGTASPWAFVMLMCGLAMGKGGGSSKVIIHIIIITSLSCVSHDDTFIIIIHLLLTTTSPQNTFEVNVP